MAHSTFARNMRILKAHVDDPALTSAELGILFDLPKPTIDTILFHIRSTGVGMPQRPISTGVKAMLAARWGDHSKKASALFIPKAKELRPEVLKAAERQRLVGKAAKMTNSSQLSLPALPAPSVPAKAEDKGRIRRNRQRNRLTTDLIQTKDLAPGIYPDGGGLYMLVRVGGEKVWRFRGCVPRPDTKKRDWFTEDLGAVRFMSLEHARRLANDLRTGAVSMTKPAVKGSPRGENATRLNNEAASAAVSVHRSPPPVTKAPAAPAKAPEPVAQQISQPATPSVWKRLFGG